MRLAGQIKGKEVIDSSGIVVGKVKDFEINPNNNQLEAIVLGEGGLYEMLGLSQKEILITPNAVKIGDRLLIKKID